MTIQCKLCDATAPADFDEMCDAGWIPGWWEDGQETCTPVCPDCVQSKLVFNEEHGDYERRPLPVVAVDEYGSLTATN